MNSSSIQQPSMFSLVSHWVHNNTQTNWTFGSFHSVPAGQNEKNITHWIDKKFPRKTYLEKMLKFKHSKTESNWTSSTIFFVHLETPGFFSPLQWTSVIFLFSFLVYLFVLLCYSSSFPFYFQCNLIKSVKRK